MIVRSTHWISLIISLRGSALLAIVPRLLVVTGAAITVTVAHELWQAFGETSSLTLVPFSLVGVALGVFLGFRNNTAYDRFWEGRKLWGRLVNISRSLTRQLITMVAASDEKDAPAVSEAQKELVYRLIGYVHALRLHLRDQDDLGELTPFLPELEVIALPEQHNRPIAILLKMGKELHSCWKRGWIDTYHFAELERSLTELTTIQGACERIKNTPIPFSYTVLIHRIVALYCLGLPFGIVHAVGVLTPLVVGMVSYAFFGLDAIGDEIEQPFGLDPNDLPLAQLSKMIEVNLRQALAETPESLPALLAPDKRGLVL